uniref:Uncharacterized protein n=1 Tax=Ananas comosus var. bracteatus TaxID=296719 RepID=A0A6V7PNZ4_ANACO|nr:unnamed protein product [Ananas comosus var. bracteatus]
MWSLNSRFAHRAPLPAAPSISSFNDDVIPVCNIWHPGAAMSTLIYWIKVWIELVGHHPRVTLTQLKRGLEIIYGVPKLVWNDSCRNRSENRRTGIIYFCIHVLVVVEPWANRGGAVRSASVYGPGSTKLAIAGRDTVSPDLASMVEAAVESAET